MFELLAIDLVDIDGPEALRRQSLMSPFVWRDDTGALLVLLRVVPDPLRPDDITGRIWLGRCGGEGLRFHMDPAPLLEPGPGPRDIGGCEDPTVVLEGQRCLVYYTGLNENGDGELLYADGPDIHHLTKRGVALASSKTQRNTKEAAVAQNADGRWRLLYEYSRDCKSRIGLAYARAPEGPWDEQDDPFVARADKWDSWHLSTGPLLMSKPDKLVMFYNGADRAATWGTGWVVFDRACSKVIARSDEPLIGPPEERYEGRDIFFACSAIECDGEIWIYGSKNDHRVVRARVRRSGKRPAADRRGTKPAAAEA
ncbi:MAG: glycosidase [Novosphingobium sp.]|nr:glycosidase [Novosphingobium sp.]